MDYIWKVYDDTCGILENTILEEKDSVYWELKKKTDWEKFTSECKKKINPK